MKYVPLSTLDNPPDRTYGKTRDCRGCRHWSELYAKQIGRGPLNCRCLNANSPEYCKYMAPRDWCKLEVRKGMFMNSLIVDEFTRNRTGVIFKVEGKPRLRYMLKVEREIFSREIQVSAYIGTNHGRQASYWEWQQLPPQGWKKDVLLMKVWPEWTPDDFNANS
jgi:hypothetical protein